MKKKINNLKSTNSKEYQEIINTGIKQNNPYISIDVFLLFVKAMNAGSSGDDSIHELINEVDNLNTIINYPITKEEIEKAIKK